MIRALIGDGFFGLCPRIGKESVTFWRLIVNEESILGKAISVSDVDSEDIFTLLMPDEMDQVSDNFQVARIP